MPRRPDLGFEFDSRTGRYRQLRTGRFVSDREIQRAIDQVIGRSSLQIERLGGELRSGRLSLEEWEIAMRAEIKNTQLVTAMAAKGGRLQMTPADYGRVGQRVRQEYAYLQRFADQIAAGNAPLDGRFGRRSIMYAKAARGTFHEVGRAEQGARGFLFERNVIRAGDNCGGCLAATANGAVPIGTLTPIGKRDCLSNCRCEIVYSREA